MALGLLAGLAGGCDTGTDPMEPDTFDAEAALEDYAAMDSVLASSGMAGFRALGATSSLDAYGPEIGIAMALVDTRSPQGAEGSRAYVRRIAAAAAALAPGAARSPVISPFSRGKTFVYDPALGRYAPDPDRTDAPATGVRFVLYAPGQGGKPDVQRVIGHADLIDEGDGSAEDLALRLVVVEEERTVLDYRTTVDALDDGGSITVDGFIRGKYDQLDFDLDVQGKDDGGLSTVAITFDMWMDTRDFHISGSVNGLEEGSDGSGDVDITVSHGDESLRVDVTGSDTSLDGTFYLNGGVFATVSGDPDDPTFVGAGGEPLTAPEVVVLLRIVDVVEDVFDLFEDLIDPIDELVLLAIIL
jgi:hypothetical protein